MRLLFTFMQNPWQGLVWWVDGGTVCRRRPYNRENLRDMVHSFVCLSVGLFACILNVETAEPIGLNFFVGPRVTPVLWMIKISKICLQQNSIFILNFEYPRNFCLFLFYNFYKENMFTIETRDGCEALKA